MAGDFLSQEEVDALLKGVTGETDEPEGGSSEDSTLRPYNIGTQERIVRGRMPTLELVNERFARYLRIGLFNYMHRNTEISVGPIRVQKYSEFIRNLVVPTNLNLVMAKPLRGTSLFIFDPNLVFLVVDNMFGGDGRFHTRVEGRDFTPTEQRIIQGLLNVVFAEYSRSWKPVYELNFEYIRSEMNSQFANIATPSEIVVSTTFHAGVWRRHRRHAHLFPLLDARADPRSALQQHAERPDVIGQALDQHPAPPVAGCRGRNRGFAGFG